MIDQGAWVPQDAAPSLRGNFRGWLLPGVFDAAVRAINTSAEGQPSLTGRQLDDLKSQLLRQPNRTLLEANEAVQALLFKAQVDVNEGTGERDPAVRLIDFHNPESNQFRIDTPGCVRQFIIPDIELFVNGAIGTIRRLSGMRWTRCCQVTASERSGCGNGVQIWNFEPLLMRFGNSYT